MLLVAFRKCERSLLRWLSTKLFVSFLPVRHLAVVTAVRCRTATCAQFERLLLAVGVGELGVGATLQRTL